MQTFRYKKGIKANGGSRVVALGFFDGIHKGHRTMLSFAKFCARRLSLPFSVFTFESEGFRNKGAKLYSTEERLRMLEGIGADEVFLADFGSLADMSPEDFVSEVLIGSLSASLAVSGEDFRFGRGGSGDTALLEALMREAGRDAYTCPLITEGGEKISQSSVRRLLSEGRCEDAERLLGEPYFILGEVRHGRGEGRGLGIPTVNTDLPDKDLLRRGVYLSSVTVDGKRYAALTNVGTCPSFGEREMHAETFILGYSGDLYGEKIKIYLLSYLREETEFSCAAELLSQIEKDRVRAMEIMEERYVRKLD